MDQRRFESEVMRELAGEAPPASADEPLDASESATSENDEAEGYEEDSMEDALVEEMDTFEEGGEESFFDGDGFDEGSADEPTGEWTEYQDFDADAVEAAMADALEAEDTDEFFRALLSGVSQAAGVAQRGASGIARAARRAGEAVAEGAAQASVAGIGPRAARRVSQAAREASEAVVEGAGRASIAAGQVGRTAREAAQAPSPLRHLLQALRQQQRQGFDELESLEALTDEIAAGDFDEVDVNTALPVLGGLTARAVLAPQRATGRLSRPVRERLVQSATQAASTLVRRCGRQAIRALPGIARRVARTAAREGLRPGALPQVLQRTTARVVANTELASPRPTRHGFPRRLIVNGPVEIRILGQ